MPTERSERDGDTSSDSLAPVSERRLEALQVLEPSFARLVERQAELVDRMVTPSVVAMVQRQVEMVEQIVNPSVVEMVQRQAEMIDRIVTPSVVEMVQRQAEMIDRIVTPSVVEMVQRQAEMIDRIVTPSVARMIDRHFDAMNAAMSRGVFEGIQAQVAQVSASALWIGRALEDLAAASDVAETHQTPDGMASPLPVEACANVIALVVTLWLIGMYLSELNRTGESVAEMNRMDLIQSLGWCVGVGLGARALVKKAGEQ